MKLLVLAFLLLALASPTLAAVDRIDISPAIMVNLSSSHSGAFMGGAVTGDMFLNRWFAIRTTLGYSKDRYFPSDRDYDEADHGLWLSIAPYGEFAAAGTIRPYLAVLGTFSAGGSGYVRSPGHNELAPVNRIRPAAGANTAYSFGGTLGTKVRVAGPVSVFAEISHFFFSSISRDNRTFEDGLPDVAFNYDWDKNPTYISAGFTYTLSLKKQR